MWSISTAPRLNIDKVPIDDPATYKLYSDGRTIGTFQFESAGMQKYLRELQPSTFEDLIAMNALYRPGPMDYIPDFIDRKHGRKPIEYDIPVMEKYLKEIPKHEMGRLRYNPVSMLKTILFGFMTNGYVSLRELEDSCKVNLRFMYLMDHKVPSYRTFGYFINEILSDSIEKLFCDINQKIFEKEHTDLQHLYIDGSKFEANANKYSWVWKKATEKSRYRLFEKITSLFQEINLELQYTGIKFRINTEYSPEYLKEAASKYVEIWQLDEATFVAGKGHRKSVPDRLYNCCRSIQTIACCIDIVITGF